MTVGLSYHWLKLISLWVVNIEPVLASLFDSTLGFGDLTSHSTLPSVPHCTAEDPYLESTAAIVVDESTYGPGNQPVVLLWFLSPVPLITAHSQLHS